MKNTSISPGDRRDAVLKIQYLEIVTNDVDSVCTSYAKAIGAQFSAGEERLGNARLARLNDGSLVGIRAPLRSDEDPVIRPYWLVDDIEAAVKQIVDAGGQIAHPPLEIPGFGTFAIYLQGGNNHGLWQL